MHPHVGDLEHLCRAREPKYPCQVCQSWPLCEEGRPSRIQRGPVVRDKDQTEEAIAEPLTPSSVIPIHLRV
jgi:hypothetical protein